jgi:zinc protease
VILLHKQITTSPLVEVRMYSLGGLLAEDEKTNGLGNFTMQMLPRGTKTRSAEQIAEFFDSVGGSLETSCGNNSWSWNMTCLKDDLSKSAEVYADVVNNPSFSDSEIPEMKQRIVAGIDSEDADWYQQANRFFRQQYFGSSKSPYQFITIGQKQIVSDATADQMRQWYENKILKGRRVIAIFGDVSLDDAQTMAKKYFGSGEKIESAVTSPLADQLKPASGEAAVEVQRVEVQKTDQPLAGIVIGFKSDSLVSRSSNFALDVLDTMTSGWGYPTGYLFDTLRGRGLVYIVQANDMPGVRGDLPGAFVVAAGCDPKNVNTVVDLILENIARCQGTDQDMQTDWFERSKLLINTGEAMDNETPEQQATTAALDELYGLGYDFHAHFAERINAVTLDQVREVARSRVRQCVVTVSTPMPDLVDKKTGTRTYSSFPPVDLTPRGVQHDVGK